MMQTHERTPTHAKDLRPVPNRGANIVIVTDGHHSAPVLKTVFIDGQEFLMPEGATVTADYSSLDLTRISLELIAGDVSVVTEDEIQERLITGDR